MKKIVAFLMIFVLCMSTALYADTPLKKLGRGFANIVTSPMEIVNRIGKANEENGIIAACTWGFMSGLYHVGARIVVGAYEVVTFPIPLPAHYEPIMTDPEFFLGEGSLF